MKVRFAPSPTGFLHVGGLRTALYNYLFARHHGGTFILRIEDTDRARYVEGAVENLIATLRWAGLDYDEGPGKGGAAAPYVQSERLALYRAHVDQLLQSGKAYHAFDTADELEEMRKEQDRTGAFPKYDRRALRLAPEDVRRKLESGEPHVVRMKVPEGGSVVFDDLVRGPVEFSTEQLDDQVLLKSDGFPTYHLANVVDDHTMGVTHVIRGEEWLSSTPKHVLLYRFFAWDMPRFAHLPLLLNPDRSKLSKRQGDVAVEDYKAKGYLPEALVNFVALLGWNPGDDREIFSLNTLVEEFSIERVGKSGAVFNLDKLNWMNGQYVRRKSTAELAGMVMPFLREAGVSSHEETYVAEVVRLLQERVTTLQDFVTMGSYFWNDPAEYDEASRKKYWRPESLDMLRAVQARLDGIPVFDVRSVEEAVRATAEQRGVGSGKIIHPLRLALTGVSQGPGLFELMTVLGKETCLRRIGQALQTLG